MLVAKVLADNLSPASFFDIFDEEDFLLTDKLIENEFAEEQQIDHPYVEKSIFNRVTLTTSSFYKFEATDVIFNNCDFSNCNLEEAVLLRCEFRNCKMLGLNLNNAYISTCEFENCLMDLASINKVQLKTTHFIETSLKDVGFADNKLTKTTFASCKLNQISTYGTSLKGLDLTSNSFESLEADLASIRGVIVNEQQAAVLAQRYLNLSIKY